MAKLLASLTFACFLTFGAGCLGDSAPADDAAAIAPPDLQEATPEPAPTGDDATEAPPTCPENAGNNYGISVNADGLYIDGGRGEPVVYQESNGCDGLQTKSSWPHNPDTAIVDLGAPISGKA